MGRPRVTPGGGVTRAIVATCKSKNLTSAAFVASLATRSSKVSCAWCTTYHQELLSAIEMRDHLVPQRLRFLILSLSLDGEDGS